MGAISLVWGAAICLALIGGVDCFPQHRFSMPSHFSFSTVHVPRQAPVVTPSRLTHVPVMVSVPKTFTGDSIVIPKKTITTIHRRPIAETKTVVDPAPIEEVVVDSLAQIDNDFVLSDNEPKKAPEADLPEPMVHKEEIVAKEPQPEIINQATQFITEEITPTVSLDSNIDYIQEQEPTFVEEYDTTFVEEAEPAGLDIYEADSPYVQEPEIAYVEAEPAFEQNAESSIVEEPLPVYETESVYVQDPQLDYIQETEPELVQAQEQENIQVLESTDTSKSKSIVVQDSEIRFVQEPEITLMQKQEPIAQQDTAVIEETEPVLLDVSEPVVQQETEIIIPQETEQTETIVVEEPISKFLPQPVQIIQREPVTSNQNTEDPLQSETFNTYTNFLNHWLQLASVNLNRPDLLELVNPVQPVAQSVSFIQRKMVEPQPLMEKDSIPESEPKIEVIQSPTEMKNEPITESRAPVEIKAVVDPIEVSQPEEIAYENVQTDVFETVDPILEPMSTDVMEPEFETAPATEGSVYEEMTTFEPLLDEILPETTPAPLPVEVTEIVTEINTEAPIAFDEPELVLPEITPEMIRSNNIAKSISAAKPVSNDNNNFVQALDIQSKKPAVRTHTFENSKPVVQERVFQHTTSTQIDKFQSKPASQPQMPEFQPQHHFQHTPIVQAQTIQHTPVVQTHQPQRPTSVQIQQHFQDSHAVQTQHFQHPATIQTQHFQHSPAVQTQHFQHSPAVQTQQFNSHSPSVQNPTILQPIPRVTSRGRFSGFRYSFAHVPQKGTFFLHG